MNDEIKEILDDLDYAKQRERGTITLTQKDINLLLDYITNLQKENEELKKNQRYHKKFGNDYIFCLENDKETYKDYIFELQEENEMYSQLKDEYEDIIKKAIEYNYELQERYCHSALFDDLVASKIYEITEKQLNILQGVGKNE